MSLLQTVNKKRYNIINSNNNNSNYQHKMKRSTTPAIKEKTFMVKSNANLKVASQLKIFNKDVKKTLYSKISSTNQQNSAL